MTTYQFDTSQPYVLHTSNKGSFYYLLFAALFFICGLLEPNFGMLFIILSIVLAYYGLNEQRKKDMPLQIDCNGITPFEEKTILWQNISRCYYHTTGLNAYHTYYLIVVTKGSDTIQIRLNDFSYNGKELADAIDSYAGRKIFGQTKEDQIKEIKGLLIALVCVIAFVSFIILMLSLSQGE